MPGYKLQIEYKIIPHIYGEKDRSYRRYFCYEFRHPLHGKKYFGCFLKDSPKHFNEAASAFTLNCGHKDRIWQNHFTFVRYS